VGGACGTHGRGEKMYRIMMGKPEGKRPLVRSRHRWENGIRLTGVYGVDSFDSG
jgi:hypothetical protein